jgi:hypothetical protein
MKNVRKTELNGTLIQRTTTVSRRHGDNGLDKRLLVENNKCDLSCACFLQLRDTLFEGFVGPGSVLLAVQPLRIEFLGVCLLILAIS